MYVAYALIVLHVVFGVLQGETSRLLAWTLGGGRADGVHASRASRLDKRRRPIARNRVCRVDGFVDVCSVAEIPEKRAVVTCLSGERVAVFRYDGRVSAISNVCQHQNGPLGEGRIVNGCVVCPWHGYEYVPDTGASPPPFTEKVPTFDVRVVAGRVLVHPQPHPPGTRVEPAMLDGGPEGLRMRKPEEDEFFIGYAPPMPPRLGAVRQHEWSSGSACVVVVVAVDARAGPRAARGRHLRVRTPAELQRDDRRAPVSRSSARWRRLERDALAAPGRSGQARRGRPGQRAGRTSRHAHRHSHAEEARTR